MSVRTLKGPYVYAPEAPGQTAALTFQVGEDVGPWVEAVLAASGGDEAVLRYEGLTVYLKSRQGDSRWMLARPDATSLVATLSLTLAVWEEILGAIRDGRSLDLRPRMEKRPWNNLGVAFVPGVLAFA